MAFQSLCPAEPEPLRLILTIIMTKTTISYAPPRCEYDESALMDLLCTSPEDGGLEDIGYEDWIE